MKKKSKTLWIVISVIIIVGAVILLAKKDEKVDGIDEIEEFNYTPLYLSEIENIDFSNFNVEFGSREERKDIQIWTSPSSSILADIIYEYPYFGGRILTQEGFPGDAFLFFQDSDTQWIKVEEGSTLAITYDGGKTKEIKFDTSTLKDGKMYFNRSRSPPLATIDTDGCTYFRPYYGASFVKIPCLP